MNIRLALSVLCLSVLLAGKVLATSPVELPSQCRTDPTGKVCTGHHHYVAVSAAEGNCRRRTPEAPECQQYANCINAAREAEKTDKSYPRPGEAFPAYRQCGEKLYEQTQSAQ